MSPLRRSRRRTRRRSLPGDIGFDVDAGIILASWPRSRVSRAQFDEKNRRVCGRSFAERTCCWFSRMICAFRCWPSVIHVCIRPFYNRSGHFARPQARGERGTRRWGGDDAVDLLDCDLRFVRATCRSAGTPSRVIRSRSSVQLSGRKSRSPPCPARQLFPSIKRTSALRNRRIGQGRRGRMRDRRNRPHADVCVWHCCGCRGLGSLTGEPEITQAESGEMAAAGRRPYGDGGRRGLSQPCRLPAFDFGFVVIFGGLLDGAVA